MSPTGSQARSPDQRYFEDYLAGGLAGTGAVRTADVRTIQDLVSRFSQDNLRDDMTILVARVRPGDQGRIHRIDLPARLALGLPPHRRRPPRATSVTLT